MTATFRVDDGYSVCIWVAALVRLWTGQFLITLSHLGLLPSRIPLFGAESAQVSADRAGAK
jgi:hypothetical protein